MFIITQNIYLFITLKITIYNSLEPISFIICLFFYFYFLEFIIRMTGLTENTCVESFVYKNIRKSKH